MSDCHFESAPKRCPTDGMISALDGGGVFPVGMTGVTRLIEIGVLTIVVAFVCAFEEPPTDDSVRMIVAVNVPLGRLLGSVEICRVMPAGVRTPVEGETVSHGSSTVAEKLKLPVGNPGMNTCCTT